MSFSCLFFIVHIFLKFNKIFMSFLHGFLYLFLTDPFTHWYECLMKFISLVVLINKRRHNKRWQSFLSYVYLNKKIESFYNPITHLFIIVYRGNIMKNLQKVPIFYQECEKKFLVKRMFLYQQELTLFSF